MINAGEQGRCFRVFDDLPDLRLDEFGSIVRGFTRQ